MAWAAGAPPSVRLDSASQAAHRACVWVCGWVGVGGGVLLVGEWVRGGEGVRECSLDS